MKIPIYLILVSVSMSAFAQLLLKRGMMQRSDPTGEGVRGILNSAQEVFTNPNIISGFALYGVGAVLWLWVLAKMELSAAYPFVGLSFIVTMALSVWFLGETVGPLRLAGTCLIVVGCVLVAKSA